MKSKTLMTLFWPCFFEILFMMLAGMIDTLMLSYLNDEAVGAVGSANTYLGILIIMFSVISTGMVAVMTQYIGANREDVAKRARNIGLILNIAVGLLLSLILGFGAESILIFMKLSPALLSYGTTYMSIIGGTCILIAIIPIYNCYLRSFGHTKEPMIATITANILNLVLNAVFLFGFNMGVAGVAIATVISRVINLIILMICSKKYINIEPVIHSTSEVTPEYISTRTLLKQIFKIGIPAAAETALYDLSMAIIMMCLNDMDSEGINATAKAYVTTITNFSYCAGAALAQSNCILLGWNIGKKDYKKCYTDTAKALKLGLIIAISISITIFLLATPILHLFSDNQVIIDLSIKLLFIDIFLELGRVANLIFANALKTTGDSIYIVIVASIIMLLVGAGGTYILGIQLELFAIGAFISMALDEILRGAISIRRFFSKKWETKTLI